MMTVVQVEASRIALKEMMEKGRVDICLIDHILKMTGGVPEHADYDSLRLLHCVDFKNYSQTMRMELPGLLRRVLESPSMEVNVTFRPLSRPPQLLETN